MGKEIEKYLETLSFVSGVPLLNKKERREKLLAAIKASKNPKEQAIAKKCIEEVAKELGYPTSYEE